MIRLNACVECGVSLIGRKAGAKFCGPEHRQAWNNRRLQRGAELYDLFMALRFDRTHATNLKAWRTVCRMASDFRHEDRRDRDGRPSWRPPEEIIARKPYLIATTIVGPRR